MRRVLILLLVLSTIAIAWKVLTTHPTRTARVVVVTHASGDSSAWLGGLLLIALSVVVYIIPALIAHSRHHHQRAAITVLNLLGGWTAIGWLIAIVWASSQVRTSPRA